MALSTNCCLHHSSPPPSSSPMPRSLPPKTAPILRQQKSRPWQNQLAIGMACVILGQEIGSAVVIADQEVAFAAGETPYVAGKPIKNVQIRWSEKRSCPPWQANSLETIVPEDLPRPSSRRRWEIVGYSSSQPAPSVKYVNKNIKQCFSL